MEACVHKEVRHGMRGDGLAVDGGDEYTLMRAVAHALLTAGTEEVREAGGGLRALGLLCGKKDEDVGITTAKPGDELAVAENHFRISGAG